MTQATTRSGARVRRPVTWIGMLLMALAVIGTCLAIRFMWGPTEASAEPNAGAPATPKALAPVAPTSSSTVAPVRPTRPVPASAVGNQGATGQSSKPAEKPKIVATVNGEQITRDQLAAECLRHYGKEVLESMINKYLIMQECKRRNVVISRQEVDAEIQRMATRFGLSVDQWLKMLKQERGITPVQYANDIIWPTLALRKLAGQQLQVTPEEVQQAFENQYGPAVRVRLIACKDRQLAEKVRAAAAAKPDEFPELAKQYSEDPSASVKGLVPPIRKHGGFKEIEDAAFSMKDGEVSQVIPIGDQYVIIKREVLLPGVKSVDFRQVAPRLEEVIRDRKLRAVAGEVFRQLQRDQKVENIFNDPEKSRAMPGVAATINGQPITLQELAEQCIERYGEQVLEGTINRRLLEQACRRRNITVTAAELDEEISRVASVMLPLTADGKPDVQGWLKKVTEEQGISVEIYRQDAVWPSVALKKLAAASVKVTEEDLQKGFEANYGPRVRCRAIVLNNARRAQEVWEKARRNPTAEFFGTLAEQYSIEPGSQALRGEVPPIRKHGGQPALEKEAFSLKPGELSSIVQIGDKYVILFCEGYTKPIDVKFEEVKDEIHKDIYEKKLRLAMAEYFEHLQETASIDNYLAGTSHAPQPKPAFGPQPPDKQNQQAVSGSKASASTSTATRPATIAR